MMKNHDLTFGAGKRVCMGKSVSILETYKVMTTLFLTYEVSGLLECSSFGDRTDILLDESCGSKQRMVYPVLLVYEADWDRCEASEKEQGGGLGTYCQ